jgi:hypothetical protein
MINKAKAPSRVHGIAQIPDLSLRRAVLAPPSTHPTDELKFGNALIRELGNSVSQSTTAVEI